MLKKILLITLGILVALAIILPIYIYHELGQSAGNSSSKVAFEIQTGESTSQIMNRLSDQKLISSNLAFLFYVRFKHKTLKSGKYYLASNYSLKTIIDTLDGGVIQFHKITIPEGWRTEQIAQRLDSQGITKYDDFISAASGYEGFLFPDTYELELDVTAKEIVDKLVANFNIRSEGLGVTLDDIKLASIVEREAENDDDRSGIAGVFENRLKIDMKLQSDVTVVYQKDNNSYPKVGGLEYKFWQQLSSGDTNKIQGKYSTYQNAGLPPDPICNPGLPSINAALNPEQNQYYYFLYGKDDKIRYATTQAEQDQNANKYLY